MNYPLIGLLAIVLHLIINHDILITPASANTPAGKEYRRYLIAVLLYYVADSLWSIFNHLGLNTLLYIDTVAYHTVVILTVVFWCLYVAAYLHLGASVGKVIKGTVVFICVAGALALLVNFFYPVFFKIGPNGEYQVSWARYLALLVQIFLFGDISILSILKAKTVSGKLRRRYVTIFMFSLVMMLFLIAQSFWPLEPCYTLGLLISTCVLHVFIQEDEKAEMTQKIVQNEKRLKETTDIISASEMGVWDITIKEGCAPKIVADAKMKELLGLPADCGMSNEEIYEHWFSRIDKDALPSVKHSMEMMMSGVRDENTYKWWHPVLGERYIRCGGTAVKVPGGYEFSGYHCDVTEQKKNEIRSGLIINSFAQSYSYINYMSLNRGTYISYKGKGLDNKYIAEMLNEGNIEKSLKFACESLVSSESREMMEAFSDISTVNDRMSNCTHLEEQFKAVDDRWYEWSYVVAERNDDGTIKHLLWAIREIDDQKQLEIRKQEALDENIAANKAKTLFLQNMSHEIRTPLNAMFGFAQLLGLPDGTWSEEEREEYNRFILNSYNMLDMLIGDILDVADAEHGNYRINISDVCVNNICRNAMMSVEYRKPSNVNLYFTTELSDDFIVQSDGRRLQQVIINYLTNACKHTSKGEIHLHCSTSEHPGKITFSVTDTGTGVPADKADIIFNRFTKLDSFTQGSGLGLNICQMVANKLDGEVYLDKNYTGGARFVFVINI